MAPPGREHREEIRNAGHDQTKHCRHCKGLRGGCACPRCPRPATACCSDVVSAIVTCRRKGCSRNPYQGIPGNYCGRTCQNDDKDGSVEAFEPPPVMDFAPPVRKPRAPRSDGVLCIRPGCSEQSYDGQRGSFCTLSCRKQGPAPQTFCTEASSEEWDSVTSQLLDKWSPDDSRGSPQMPKKIFKIHVSRELQNQFDRTCHKIGKVKAPKGKNPGNVCRRVHGTRQTCRFLNGQPCTAAGCLACSIMRRGFDITYLGTSSKNSGYFGPGHYTTSCFSTALGYGNVLLVCLVAVGKSEIVDDRTSAAIPDTFDSRLINKPSGVDEIVVPKDCQILPRYLMMFDK